MKIYDCFPFFNELELLELRLNELNNVVDKFVLVESIHTYSGKSKELVFDKNKSLFNEFSDKIIHIVVKDMPNNKNPRANESHQRQCMWRGLIDAEVGDIIMMGDLDEIPRAESVKGINKDFHAFEQACYYMYMNAYAGKWKGTRSFRFNGVRGVDMTNDIRFRKNQPDDCILRDAGWHFTYLGGVDRIALKFGSFCHTEYDNPQSKSPDRLSKCMDDLKDPAHGNQLQLVEVDDTYPKYLLDNIDRFKQFIK